MNYLDWLKPGKTFALPDKAVFKRVQPDHCKNYLE